MGEPLPFVPGAIKLVTNGTNTENNWANVLHFQYSGPAPTAGFVADTAAEAYNAWEEYLLPLCPPDTTFTGVEVTDLSSDTGAGGEYTAANSGTSTADHLPGGTCVLIDYPSSFRYRGGHPRTYLYIGADENMQDECTWNSAFVTTVTGAWGNFISALSGTTGGGTTIGLQCAISYVSKTSNPVAPYRRAVPIIMPFPANQFTVQPRMASQRRRVRRGR